MASSICSFPELQLVKFVWRRPRTQCSQLIIVYPERPHSSHLYFGPYKERRFSLSLMKLSRPIAYSFSAGESFLFSLKCFNLPWYCSLTLLPGVSKRPLCDSVLMSSHRGSGII